MAQRAAGDVDSDATFSGFYPTFHGDVLPVFDGSGLIGCVFRQAQSGSSVTGSFARVATAGCIFSAVKIVVGVTVPARSGSFCCASPRSLTTKSRRSADIRRHCIGLWCLLEARQMSQHSVFGRQAGRHYRSKRRPQCWHALLEVGFRHRLIRSTRQSCNPAGVFRIPLVSDSHRSEYQ